MRDDVLAAPQRCPISISERLTGAQECIDLALGLAGAAQVHALVRRQFEQAQRIARLVSHPVVKRLVRCAVTQQVGRSPVASHLQGCAQGQAAVGSELDGTAAERFYAFQ